MKFTVEQVRVLLELADQTELDCRRQKVDAIARRHLDDVERKIRDLDALRSELHDMIDHCGCSTVADCRIIKALSASA